MRSACITLAFAQDRLRLGKTKLNKFILFFARLALLWLSPKISCASAIKKLKNFVFIFYCARLALLWLSPKISCASAIKKSKNFVFIFYCARLALLWLSPKIGCASAIKNQKTLFLFFIALGLHYLCTWKNFSLVVSGSSNHAGAAYREVCCLLFLIAIFSILAT